MGLRGPKAMLVPQVSLETQESRALEASKESQANPVKMAKTETPAHRVTRVKEEILESKENLGNLVYPVLLEDKETQGHQEKRESGVLLVLRALQDLLETRVCQVWKVALDLEVHQDQLETLVHQEFRANRVPLASLGSLVHLG